MHVRRSGIRSIRRATLWAFSNFGFGSSARTFVSVRCLVMSCAPFRVLLIRLKQKQKNKKAAWRAVWPRFLQSHV